MSRTLLLLIMSTCLFAQRTASVQQPVAATVCELMHNPAAFSGRIVKVRATVVSGNESSTIVDANDNPCSGPWFWYAPKDGGESRDSRDAELQRRNSVFLKEDENMKHFTAALEAFFPPGDKGGRRGRRYNVTATMTGRVDDAGANGRGFGHLGAYRIRFLLISVDDVSVEERQ